MWADLPIRGPSTLAFGGPSGIPWRTEWLPSSSNNNSTQITSSQHECAWWCFFPACNRRMWVQGPISWQWFNIYFPHMACHGTSPPKWTVKSAWPWRSVNSYCGQLWKPLVKYWGVPPPRRPASMAQGAPSSLALEDSAKPMDTSSQASLWVSIPDNAELGNQTLEEIYAPPSLLVETLGPGASILPGDVIQLQKETNRALGCLLATRSSLDAHGRKQVLDFEMSLHQNDSETTKAIKEAKALCASTIRGAEAHWATLISEAEGWHATCIREAEANCAATISEADGCCSMAIRKAESHGAKQAHSIQLLHAEDKQHLEMEAIEEEGKDCLSYLTTCRADLQASPPEAHGVLMTLFHLIMGNVPLATLLNIPPWYPPLDTTLPYWSLTLLPLWYPGPCPDPNDDTLPPAGLYPHLNQKALPERSLMNHHTWSERMRCLFTEIDGELAGSPCQGFGSSTEG